MPGFNDSAVYNSRLVRDFKNLPAGPADFYTSLVLETTESFKAPQTDLTVMHFPGGHPLTNEQIVIHSESVASAKGVSRLIGTLLLADKNSNQFDSMPDLMQRPMPDLAASESQAMGLPICVINIPAERPPVFNYVWYGRRHEVYSRLKELLQKQASNDTNAPQKPL